MENISLYNPKLKTDELIFFIFIPYRTFSEINTGEKSGILLLEKLTYNLCGIREVLRTLIEAWRQVLIFLLLSNKSNDLMR